MSRLLPATLVAGALLAFAVAPAAAAAPAAGIAPARDFARPGAVGTVMRLEGGDVEGHGFRGKFRAAEPAGEEGGETLYELSFEGEDVEGQGARFRI